MNNDLNKYCFETLYQRALKDWPSSIDVKELKRYSRKQDVYALPEPANELIDDISKKYWNTVDEVLINALHYEIYTLIHKLAEHSVTVHPSEIRKESIRRSLVKHLTENLESRCDWKEEDFKSVRAFLDSEQLADRQLRATMQLKPEETFLCGGWIELGNNKFEEDDVIKRINWLTINHLKLVKTSEEDGWLHLYIDPVDGRYWEVIYPEDPPFLGDTPQLKLLTPDEAITKYGSLPVQKEKPSLG